MEEVINYGWLSLIPAVVAVVLAFATRNVVLSLAISLFLGIMIQVGANPGSPCSTCSATICLSIWRQTTIPRRS